MARQGNLFDSFGRSFARQGQLFDSGPELSALSCEVCGEPLERTSSGLLCCPHGHGKLIPPTVEPCGQWFEDIPGE